MAATPVKTLGQGKGHDYFGDDAQCRHELPNYTSVIQPEGVTAESFERPPCDSPGDLVDQAETVARVHGTSVNQLIIDSLATEIDRVRADNDFMARARRLLERDQQIIDRLAKRPDARISAHPYEGDFRSLHLRTRAATLRVVGPVHMVMPRSV